MFQLHDLVRIFAVLGVATVVGSGCVGKTQVSPTPVESIKTFQVGVAVHIGGPGYGLDSTVSSLNALDAAFRNDVHWSQIETAKGVLRFPPEMKLLDDLVSAAAARHRHPILILDYGNPFYDGGGQISSPEGTEAFAKYARFVVNHFKGRVDQFEVWNEWNTGTGAAKGATTKGDPVQYANLLRATYEAVKAENPNAIVLGGVIGVGAAETAWVEKFAAAEGLNYLDGFSAHPYVQCWLRKTPGAFQAPMQFGAVPGTPEFSMQLLDKLHNTLQSFSKVRQVPIYVSEVGWPSSDGQCGVSPDKSAAYLQRFFLLANSRPWIAGAWWYDLVNDGTDPTKSEQSFGLLTQGNQPKPAYLALSTIGHLLSSGRAVATYTDGGQVVVSGETSPGKRFYAAWLQTDDFSLRQPWAQGRSLLESGMKMAGASQTGASQNGTEITIGATPTILTTP